MVDFDRAPRRFILTDSQRFGLLAGNSQSLADSSHARSQGEAGSELLRPKLERLIHASPYQAPPGFSGDVVVAGGAGVLAFFAVADGGLDLAVAVDGDLLR